MTDLDSSVTGKVVLGHGVASGRAANSPYPRGSLEMQIPCFLDRGLDLMLGLRRIDIDLGIVEGSVNNKNLVVEECKMDHLVVIMPNDHVLAGEKKLRVADFVSYPFISREHGSGTQEVITNYVEKFGNGEGLNICFELSSPEAIKGLIATGLGYGIMSRVIVASVQAGTVPMPYSEAPDSASEEEHLMRERCRRAPEPFLRGQWYLDPYPAELGLRNAI